MFRYIYKKLIRPVFLIRSSVHSIALGVALGLFISLTPTVGFQMVLVVVIGTLLGANRIIAVILCWISNPVTFLPMYYGYYYLGAKILNLDLWTFGSFSRKLQEFSAALQDLGYLETFRMFGSDILAPLWLGSIIIALVVALPSYPLTLYILNRHRSLRFARMMKRRAAIEAKRGVPGAAASSPAGGPPRGMESGEAGEAPFTTAGRGKSGKTKTLLLFLAAGLCFLSCSGRSLPGGVAHGNPSPSVPVRALAVAHADLGGKCHLFIEFPGFEEGTVRFAFLRIYNFGDAVRETPGIEDSFILESPRGRCALQLLKPRSGSDFPGVSALLDLARPRKGIPAHRWTRVAMEFARFPFPLPGGRVLFLRSGAGAGEKSLEEEGEKGGKGGNRGRLSAPGASEGEKSGILPMEFLKVPRRKWEAFKDDPTLKGVRSLLGGTFRSGN